MANQALGGKFVAAAFIVQCCCIAGAAQLAFAQTPSATAPPVPAAQTLPGGASQVQETHGNWRVTCAQPNGTKVCALSQQLADQNTRQLVLGIELTTTDVSKAQGTLVMPFGLAIDKPVTLQVDEGAAMSKPFRTCIPAGCLVTLDLDATTLASLRKGTTLSVKATADGGKEAAFKVSLDGFGSALDRTAALSK